MGEDPIIVKPGKYPGAKEGDKDRVGICLVIDDDGSWRHRRRRNRSPSLCQAMANL